MGYLPTTEVSTDPLILILEVRSPSISSKAVAPVSKNLSPIRRLIKLDPFKLRLGGKFIMSSNKERLKQAVNNNIKRSDIALFFFLHFIWQIEKNYTQTRYYTSIIK